MKTLQIQWLNFKELHNSFYDYLNKQNASVIQNDNINNNSNIILEESYAKENQEIEHLDEKDKNINQNEVKDDDIVEESTSGSEEIQSESFKEINEKVEKNEIQKSDIIEKSTSGSEEIQSENNEGINEESEKNEVQNSNKKKDVLQQDSLNASKDKNKLDKSHSKVESKPVTVYKQDKEIKS
ncbi:hypothetical protein NBO_33g0029 [Nosema bombycis CQ1]|uniref:Uncharacterized protein n=1 Tax=Nosema bombycis (strain CQ1 / CVCC 102059) TaxID=578461 RepID=R0MMX2_NOSB1|nr:hypothetical protein NBO_33g0029 [Nosema bombycis CQ1]|eukprot:EOB14223.1 hypothetical protein NBO_33g0029 [Nosema bombycis CQ1]